MDHTQFDKKDVHFDASSKADNPKWSMVGFRMFYAFFFFIFTPNMLKVQMNTLISLRALLFVGGRPLSADAAAVHSSGRAEEVPPAAQCRWGAAEEHGSVHQGQALRPAPDPGYVPPRPHPDMHTSAHVHRGGQKG